jgi:predicted HTH transcriptional regulator
MVLVNYSIHSINMTYGGSICFDCQEGFLRMSKFNTFTQLKELMFAMEQDLGISELSEPEKYVFSCIVQATEAGGSITTKAIEQHLLTSNLSRPTLFRAIKQLLAKDIITQPSHGKYVAKA